MPPDTVTAQVTAIVTAHRRPGATIETLQRILACDPPPVEVLVHVDGGEAACAAAIRKEVPGAVVIISDTVVGPGGGRNRLLEAAASDIVASFDDDSYPIDRDYFARVVSVFQGFPDAAIVAAGIYHADERIGADDRSAAWVADFVGCGCAYRKAEFLKLGGYVPVAVAYGMEEADIALRLHDAGGRILATPWLRVFHDTDREWHGNPEVNAATISNLAVLASLRYPPLLWPLGALQCVQRVSWLVKHGRRRGIVSGVLQIPSEIHRFRSYRRRVPHAAIRSYLWLRRHAVTATPECSTPLEVRG